MRQRLSGESRKGRNLAYGLRYARVITETYLRERRAAKVMPATARLAGAEAPAESSTPVSPVPLQLTNRFPQSPGSPARQAGLAAR